MDPCVRHANLQVWPDGRNRTLCVRDTDFTENTGELTPTMKVKRNVVAEKFASDIEAIYNKD
uniref:Long-chain-fatty-acid--CoA ligase FadD15 n=1 Tax=Mycobacterium riyadhense TaxID=486698 RepID=A0A653EQQ5_9MYCO|nr:Long-chain-fatty-acid--CoA ligase FadD15 [Mycobacterium riyadhense]